MIDHHHDEEIPKVPLVMIGGLALLAFALASATSAGMLSRDAVPSEARSEAGVVATAERSLFFHDEADGGVRIEDASNGAVVAMVEPGTGGFIRTTLRSLVHARRARGIGPETPFVLTEWENGTLSLSDRETGRSVELHAFGPDNREAFAVLLEGGDA